MCKDKTKYRKWREAKELTSELLDNLVQVKGSPLNRSYRLSYDCCSVLEQSGDGRIRSHYCKNRWCIICGRIKSAKARNDYLPEVKKFKEGVFVTLTKRTVAGKDLPYSIEMMEKAWRSILQSREGKRRKIKGIRKAECNVSKSNKKRFHYHLHVLMDGKENAEWLVSQWLERMGTEANREAQNIREIDDHSLEELFKYATKSIAKSEDEERGDFVEAASLDTIYRCLRNKRTFQTFGSIRKYSEDIESTDNESITGDTLKVNPEMKLMRWSKNIRTWAYEDGTPFVKPGKPVKDKIRQDTKELVEA